MDKETYLGKFAGTYDPTARAAEALHHAWDIRKFEIELYWKRAAYFWTFIAVSFAGYGAVQNLREPARTDLSVVIGCLGLVFSFAWYLINRGSKFWAVNWEKHVDILEDAVLGPLYKTIAEERSVLPPNLVKRLVTGAGRYSVSKINQIISLFVVFIWIILTEHALPPFHIHSPVNWLYVASVGGAVLACAALCQWGLTGVLGSEVVLHSRSVTVVSSETTVSQPVRRSDTSLP